MLFVLRRGFAVALVVTCLAMMPGLVGRTAAQSATPSRPWNCWSVPATGGRFAADRTCERFAAERMPGTFARQTAPPSQAIPIAFPSRPIGLAATVSGTTVALRWTTTQLDAGAVYIFEAGSASGRSDLANTETGSTATSLEVTAMPAGRYYARVRARTASGTSASSNEVVFAVESASAALCADVTDAPTNLIASVSGSSVTLSWTAPSSGCTPASYIIEAGSSSGANNLASFSTGNSATSFSAAGVGSGVYYVRVRSTVTGGVSSNSNEVVLVVGSCTGAPPAPSVVTSTVAGSTVIISWTAVVSVVSSYVLEAGSAAGLTNLANFDTGSSATTYTATGVGNGTYYVRVRGRNACGTGAASTETVVVVGATTTGTGLLSGASDFTGTYPTPVQVTYTDASGQRATVKAYPGQVSVSVNAGTPQADAEALIQSKGGFVLARIPVIGYYLAGVAVGSESTFITAIRLDPRVSLTMPNTAGSLTAAPSATILDGCDVAHGTTVKDTIVTQGGTFGGCVPINIPGTGSVPTQKVVYNLIDTISRATTNPILVNLSAGGGANGESYLAYNARECPGGTCAQDEWKAFVRRALAAVASIPDATRQNVVVTLAAGNAGMPIDALLTEIRQDPKIAAVLKTNVIVVTSNQFSLANTTNADPSRADGDVAIATNSLSAGGTSFAAPAVLAYLQTVITATGASGAVAIQAAKQAVAANANHQLIAAEAVTAARAIVSAQSTDPATASSVTGISLSISGSVTSGVITPAIAGVTVRYTVSGTDGYFDSGTIRTNSSGRATFDVPPGDHGVTDTISVIAVVSGKIASARHTW
jgi:hypothetical protein